MSREQNYRLLPVAGFDSIEAMESAFVVIGGAIVALWVFYRAFLILAAVVIRRHRRNHPLPPVIPASAEPQPEYGSPEWQEQVRRGGIKY